MSEDYARFYRLSPKELANITDHETPVNEQYMVDRPFFMLWTLFQILGVTPQGTVATLTDRIAAIEAALVSAGHTLSNEDIFNVVKAFYTAGPGITVTVNDDTNRIELSADEIGAILRNKIHLLEQLTEDLTLTIHTTWADLDVVNTAAFALYDGVYPPTADAYPTQDYRSSYTLPSAQNRWVLLRLATGREINKYRIERRSSAGIELAPFFGEFVPGITEGGFNYYYLHTGVQNLASGEQFQVQNTTRAVTTEYSGVVDDPRIAAMVTKLSTIEDGATQDQTGPDIVTLLRALTGTDRLPATAISGLEAATSRGLGTELTISPGHVIAGQAAGKYLFSLRAPGSTFPTAAKLRPVFGGNVGPAANFNPLYERHDVTFTLSATQAAVFAHNAAHHGNTVVCGMRLFTGGDVLVREITTSIIVAPPPVATPRQYTRTEVVNKTMNFVSNNPQSNLNQFEILKMVDLEWTIPVTGLIEIVIVDPHAEEAVSGNKTEWLLSEIFTAENLRSTSIGTPGANRVTNTRAIAMVSRYSANRSLIFQRSSTNSLLVTSDFAQVDALPIKVYTLT